MNNYIVIGLGILILVLIYVFYVMYASNKYIVLKQISLNDTQPPIMKSAITNPASTNFAYGFWIYVNSWSNNSGKTIMYLQNDNSNIVSAIDSTNLPSGKKLPFFSIGLDNTKLDLYCTTSKTESTFADNSKTKITSNFPIQKWTYVVVSVDGAILDCYLDGKLVISKQITNYTDFITKLKDCNIYLGDCIGNKNDFYITKFNRWDHALDPKTVWNDYLNGNGTSSYSSNYNINLEVKKNGEVYKDFSVY